MSIKKNPEHNTEENSTPKKKKDMGMRVVGGLFILSLVLGILVFRNYMQSEKLVTTDLNYLKLKAPSLTIEQCAQNNMSWYLKCDAMEEICDDTVTRMMKVCLVLGDKSAQCSAYGKEIYGYNFGAAQCKPYFKKRNQKKACADTWQTIADYCKSVQKSLIQ